MATNDLNIAMVLKLIDQVTAPAKGVMKVMDSIDKQTTQMGRNGVEWSNQQIAANKARRSALTGEAFGLAAMAGSLAATLQPAIQFEKAMSNVAAVSNATSVQQALLSSTARELGATTAWSATEAAGGMKFLGQAGFEVNETVAAMPGLLNLASAGGMDLARTADIASNILTGFNMKATEMGDLGDVLTNTFTTSNTDLAMLGDTMKYVAPNAAALNISIEQTAAMVGKLGDSGIQGSQAGTALRAMMLRMSALPKPAADALKLLDVATVDAKGNLRDMPTVLAEVDAAMKGMGTGEQAKLINDIFGMEAASAATVLLQQAGTGALQTYAETLSETGSASRVASEMMDNTAGAIKRLQSMSESVAITVGSMLLPEIVNLIETVIPLLNVFQSWAEANPELVSQIFKIIAGLLLFKLGSIGLRFALFTLLGPILQIIRFGSGLLILLPRLAAGMMALLKPMKLVRLALIGIKWAFISTGIGALIAAVAMAGIWIYNNWSGLKVFFANLWGAFRDGLGPAAPMLDAVIALVSDLWGWVSNLLGPLDASADQWAEWGKLAGGALANIIGLLSELIVGVFGQFSEKVEAVRAAFDEGLINGVFRLISEFNPFTLAIEGVVSLYALIMEFLGVPAEIVDQFKSFKLNDIGMDWMQSLWDGMAEVLPKMIAAIGAKLASLKPQWLTDLQNFLGGGDTWSAPPETFLPGRDNGGPVRAGGTYRVNERGEEFFTPNVDGRIIPTRLIKAASMVSAMATPVAAMPSSADLVSRVDTRPAMQSIMHAPQITREGDKFEIHIHAAPGMDPAAIAREVERQLAKHRAQSRANLFDGEGFE